MRVEVGAAANLALLLGEGPSPFTLTDVSYFSRKLSCEYFRSGDSR